jgi:putative membrane protein
MWGYMGNMGWGYGWGLLGVAHMVLWWILIILGIVVLGKWLFGAVPSEGRASRRRALDILGQRYARGEIDRNEFESKKSDLSR